MHIAHPVKLLVEDDLRRNRLTVFFRLILAIPHFIFIFLWTIAVVFAAIVNWVATLVQGQPPAGLHRFMCAYVRYQAHLSAYLWLVGNPYPGFVGEEGEYPIDVRLPGPTQQPRWTTFFRIFLAIPALLLATALGGTANVRVPSSGKSGTYGSGGGGGALGFAVAVLGWFASLAQGRMPKGLRDAGAYSIGYSAQMLAYLLLVTDRYPNADPTAMLEGVERPPQHPVHLVGDADDLRFSRVTVLFRLPLVIPHVVWLALWTVVALLAAIATWFATLFTGTPPAGLHRFLSRYVRYWLHVNAFLYLAANPFPGFTGELGRYPLDLELPAPAIQNRWKTGFRIFLAIPAAIVNGALSWGLGVAAFLTWFVALATGAAPWGLRNFSAYALRYGSQLFAYVFLITEAYPHASPLEGAPPAQPQFDEPA
ncbi:MAG: hypothetical protein JWM06_2219 [Actinomycetia bacterium]|nr:hypothetical protein [Actinomycetes bacterium]